MAWDDVAGKAMGGRRDKYVVIQVVLTEKLLGTGSGTASLTNLQAEINKQAAKGYRLQRIPASYDLHDIFRVQRFSGRR